MLGRLRNTPTPEPKHDLQAKVDAERAAHSEEQALDLIDVQAQAQLLQVQRPGAPISPSGRASVTT